MGSEGYLINQFLASRTNDRSDRWGGTAEKRMRFPTEIVRRTRDLVGSDFLIQYRISLLDLVEHGQSWDEVVALAKTLEEVGVDVFNTGIGWHEARIPTIITQVPRGAWRSATARLRPEVGVPVCVEPDQHARARRGDPGGTGDADLVRCAGPAAPTSGPEPRGGGSPGTARHLGDDRRDACLVPADAGVEDGRRRPPRGSCARATTSSQLWPCSTRSSSGDAVLDEEVGTHQDSRVRRTISVGYRIRFSAVPPQQ